MASCSNGKESTNGKGLLLWFLGVPLGLIIALYLAGILH